MYIANEWSADVHSCRLQIPSASRQARCISQPGFFTPFTVKLPTCHTKLSVPDPYHVVFNNFAAFIVSLVQPMCLLSIRWDRLRLFCSSDHMFASVC